MPDPQLYQEKKLLQQMAGGDEAAFSALYLRYFDLLLAQTRDITKDHTIAEDIVQEVFFRLWEKRGDFSEYDKISGWLFVCSYNGALNYLKKLGREKIRTNEAGRLSEWIEVADIGIQETQFRLMEEAIEQLPPQRKRVFLLCRYQSMSYDAAAAELSISKNTVKEHLVKAAAFIREYVAQSPDSATALATLILLQELFSQKN